MNKPKLAVFASGSAEGGGSGFEKLVEASRNGVLNAEITCVISNHANGGVRERADRLGIRFLHFEKPWSAERYQQFQLETGADFFALSGWLKLVRGLDPNTKFNSRTVFNIHPGPTQDFGGKGFFGHHVHEAVMTAYKEGLITETAVTMHFVTEEYDKGPIFFQYIVKVRDDDTADSLGERVNGIEHAWQAKITNMVVHGEIKWDGVNPDSLTVPDGYEIKRFE